MQNNIKKNNYNKGYTLIFAIIVASLVLLVGISILTTSRKEFQLASSARESIYAFYAADGGLECAVYHDQNGDKFRPGVLGDGVECAGVTPVNLGSGSNIETNFEYKLPDLTDDDDETTGFQDDPTDDACVHVKVKKLTTTSPTTGTTTRTTIDTRGYNKGWDPAGNSGRGSCFSGGIISTNRVERSLHYEYIQ